MPRQMRELEDSGIYHVYSRGNNRQQLFRDDLDFRKYLELMKRIRLRHEFKLYHYCLMDNHLHLLIEVAQADDLARIMHGLQLGYARHCKTRYEYTGHLYQGRFRSPRIAEESYYLQCGRYIERNPVAAGIVEKAEDYPYSSARYYALGERDELLTANRYYIGMGANEKERQKAYREFLAFEEPYSHLVTASLLRV